MIREGKKKEVSIHSIVLDDIVEYKLGNQVVADSIIMDGVVEVDESFITGEANHILKKRGTCFYLEVLLYQVVVYVK